MIYNESISRRVGGFPAHASSSSMRGLKACVERVGGAAAHPTMIVAALALAVQCALPVAAHAQAPATASAEQPAAAQQASAPQAAAPAQQQPAAAPAQGAQPAPQMSFPGPAQGAPATPSLWGTLLALVFVLALLMGLAWFMKRYGPRGAGAAAHLRVVSSLSLGGRERILVVEVADQWIVVGASPGRVNLLTTLAKQEGAEPPAGHVANVPSGFADWLKQTLEKRNAK
jgi:flagellar protein FliO/FliZ